MKENQTPPPQPPPPYDTNEFVRVITASGFSPKQAQGLVAGMNICLANLVTKDDLNVAIAKLIAENEKARAEAAERETRAIKDAAEREARIMSEISAMKADNEKAKAEAAEREARVMSEIEKVRAVANDAKVGIAGLATKIAESEMRQTRWMIGLVLAVIVSSFFN